MNQPEDVEVILGFKRRYRFHSGTLARNSTFFADLLTEAKAAKLNTKARSAGIKIRWMVELTLLPCDDFPAGILELVELTSTGERADGRSGLIANENGRVPQAENTYANYETILYSFYNREIIIDDGDMTAALRHCYALFTISDYLGCTSLISKPIEVALLKHGQDLFRSIQNMPGAWVQLAHSIRSELIFKECMIHLVADWKTIRTRTMVTDKLREIPGLRSLIEDYHRNLLVQCRNLELAIMASYPGSMATPADDIPIKREAYAKDILVWMALTFFRHWFSQRLMMDKGRNGLDCGYELFKQVGASGDAYMDKSVINQFHTKFPMTKKAINVLENHLSEIKECMKRIVDQHGILKSRCQLDVHRFPVKYLTCIDFKREDFPWIKEANAHVVPAKRAYKPGGNEISRQNLATLRHHQVRATSADRMDEDEIDAEFEDEAFESPTKRARAD